MLFQEEVCSAHDNTLETANPSFDGKEWLIEDGIIVKNGIQRRSPSLVFGSDPQVSKLCEARPMLQLVSRCPSLRTTSSKGPGLALVTWLSTLPRSTKICRPFRPAIDVGETTETNTIWQRVDTRYRPYLVVNTLVDPEKNLEDNIAKAEGKTDVEVRAMMGLPDVEAVRNYQASHKGRTDAYADALKLKGEFKGMVEMALIGNRLADNVLLNTWLEAMQTKFGDDVDAMHEWLTKNISAAAAESPEGGMAELAAYYAYHGHLPGFLDVWGRNMILPSEKTPNPPVREAP